MNVILPRVLFDQLVAQAMPSPGMGAGWITLIVTSSLLVYFVFGGVCQELSGEDFADEPWGLIWFLVLPHMLGKYIVRRATRLKIPRAQVHK